MPGIGTFSSSQIQPPVSAMYLCATSALLIAMLKNFRSSISPLRYGSSLSYKKGQKRRCASALPLIIKSLDPLKPVLCQFHKVQHVHNTVAVQIGNHLADHGNAVVCPVKQFHAVDQKCAALRLADPD